MQRYLRECYICVEYKRYSYNLILAQTQFYYVLGSIGTQQRVVLALTIELAASEKVATNHVKSSNYILDLLVKHYATSTQLRDDLNLFLQQTAQPATFTTRLFQYTLYQLTYLPQLLKAFLLYNDANLYSKLSNALFNANSKATLYYILYSFSLLIQ